MTIDVTARNEAVSLLRQEHYIAMEPFTMTNEETSVVMRRNL